MTTHAFASIFWSVSHDVPTYQAWLDGVDMKPVYAFHHDLLRLLDWRCPPERWVLKSSSHLWSLDALLDEYPDARIVQTHRDPLKVLASFTSLVTTLRQCYSGRVDVRRIGEQQAAFLAAGLELAVDFRERGRLPADQVLDLHFADFIADPIGGKAPTATNSRRRDSIRSSNDDASRATRNASRFHPKKSFDAGCSVRSDPTRFDGRVVLVTGASDRGSRPNL